MVTRLTTLAKAARKQLFRSAEATTPVAQRSASGRALDGVPGRFLTSEHLEGASFNLLQTRDLKFHLSSLDIQVRLHRLELRSTSGELIRTSVSAICADRLSADQLQVTGQESGQVGSWVSTR